MKNFIFIFVCLFLTTIMGCRKDEIDDEITPPILKSSLRAWAMPESVSYNGNAKIGLDVVNISYITLNGVKVKDEYLKNGFIPIDSLVETSTFNLVAFGLDNVFIYKTVTVKVVPPLVVIPNRNDTLLRNYWMLSKNPTASKYFFNGTWFYMNWSENELNQRTTFKENGTAVTIDQRTSVEVGNCNWFWIGKDSIQIGSVAHQYHFTDTTLVCSQRNGTAIIVYRGYPL